MTRALAGTAFLIVALWQTWTVLVQPEPSGKVVDTASSSASVAIRQRSDTYASDSSNARRENPSRLLGHASTPTDRRGGNPFSLNDQRPAPGTDPSVDDTLEKLAESPNAMLEAEIEGASDEFSMDSASFAEVFGPSVAANDTAPQGAAIQDHASSEHDRHAPVLISGRLLGDDGEIRPDVLVKASRAIRHDPDSPDPVHPRQFSAVTDQAGQFFFVGLDADRYRLTVNGTEYYAPASMEVRTGSRAVSLVTPRLDRVRVAGIATDRDGNPIEGVEVTIRPGGSRSLTDVDGRFAAELTVDRETEYHVVLQHEYYLKAHQAINGGVLLNSLPDAHGIHASMEYGEIQSSLFGTLQDQHGKMIAGQSVVLSSLQNNDRFQSVSDVAGNYWLDEVPIGTYRLDVVPDANASQYEPLSLDAVHLDATALELNLRLEHLRDFGSLTGKVVDPDGRPVPGFGFSVSAKMGGTNTIHARSDDLGRFVIPKVPAGMVQIRSKGQPSLSVVNIQLASGEFREIVVPVDWGGHSVSGHLVDERGSPIQGAKVTLMWVDDSSRIVSTTRRDSVTDRQGGFRFANVSPGERFLAVTANDIEPIRRSIRVGGERPVSLVAKRRI